MKKKYQIPRMWILPIEPLMIGIVEASTITLPVDPTKPVDPGEALSKDNNAPAHHSVWDE